MNLLMLIKVTTCADVCRVSAISNHAASAGEKKSVLQTEIKLWFQLASCQSSHFSWNPSTVRKYPWSVQLRHNLLHWKCLNYNQLKPKSCPAANCLSFYYGKTKLHPKVLYNRKYKWKYRKSVLLHCKIIHLHTEASFSAYSEMKQEGSSISSSNRTSGSA